MAENNHSQQQNHIDVTSKIPKYHFIKSYHDDYCEILYPSYNKEHILPAFILTLLLFVICILGLFVYLCGGDAEPTLGFVVVLVIIFLGFIIYPMAKVLIIQPYLQPIVFQRSQKKVYIYNFSIPFDFYSFTLGYYGREKPEHPDIYIWNWQSIDFDVDIHIRDVDIYNSEFECYVNSEKHEH